MAHFLIAFAAFILLHSVPAVPAIRQGLIVRLGRKTYFGLYSLVSLVMLGWLFHAALRVDYVPLWEPRAWQAWLALVTAPAGLFLVLAGLFSANPLSISVRQGEEPGAVATLTRHPVLWGFLLWALGHAAVNGDLRSAILFGGFALFSAGAFPMLDRRAARRLGPLWPEMARRFPALPFAALVKGRARPALDAPMLAAALATAALTLWLLAGGHAWLFGADPLALAAAL